MGGRGVSFSGGLGTRGLNRAMKKLLHLLLILVHLSFLEILSGQDFNSSLVDTAAPLWSLVISS